jgi:hypothetical protein
MTAICRIVFTMELLAAAAAGGCVASETEPAADETGGVASELASDCENGANGFIDIPDNLSGIVQRRVMPNDTVSLTLESKTIAGLQRGFAKISGATQTGDQVSMDWTIHGQQPNPPVLVRCGPFIVSSNGMSKTSAAKVTNSSPTYQFRACAQREGSSICSGWW